MDTPSDIPCYGSFSQGAWQSIHWISTCCDRLQLPLPALMIAVMRWQSSGQDVDKLRGHLSRAIKLLSSVCICPGAWRHPFEVMNNDAVYK